MEQIQSDLAEPDFSIRKALFEQMKLAALHVYNIPEPAYLDELNKALEKLLKGCIVQFANQLPPKSHNLDALARQTTLKFPENWLEDLAEITRHFWRVRYPDFQKFVYTSKETVEPTYSKTQEVFTWIKQQLLKI